MLKVVVLISGRGSNLKAIINKCSKKKVPAKVIAIISNNSTAPGLKLNGKFQKIIINNKLSKKKFEIMDRNFNSNGMFFNFGKKKIYNLNKPLNIYINK